MPLLLSARVVLTESVTRRDATRFEEDDGADLDRFRVLPLEERVAEGRVAEERVAEERVAEERVAVAEERVAVAD